MRWEQIWIPAQFLLSHENKEANGIPEEAFDMMIGNIIDDQRSTG